MGLFLKKHFTAIFHKYLKPPRYFSFWEGRLSILKMLPQFAVLYICKEFLLIMASVIHPLICLILSKPGRN